MTLDYNVILPITLTVAIASGVRWFFLRETLYTMKLVRRGHHVPKALQANFHYETTAREMMDTGFRVLPGAMRLQAFADLALDAPDTSHFIVDSGNGAFTVVSRDAALAALRDASKGLRLEQVPAAGHVAVREATTLMDILGAMGAKGVSVAVVVDDPVHPATGAIRGILTHRQITGSLVESAKLYV
jgi:CIC family chloride channel protein